MGFSGYPPPVPRAGTSIRSLGAAALDLCAVAEGVLDGYAVVGGSQLGSWDYLGGLLICTEAGAVVGESQGRDLVTLDHADRRTPVAASTPALAVPVVGGRQLAWRARAFSSVGQSSWLTTSRSSVRVR